MIPTKNWKWPEPGEKRSCGCASERIDEFATRQKVCAEHTQNPLIYLNPMELHAEVQQLRKDRNELYDALYLVWFNGTSGQPMELALEKAGELLARVKAGKP